MELIAIGCVWVDPSKVTAFYVTKNASGRYDVNMMVGETILECNTGFYSEEAAMVRMDELVSKLNKYRNN
jgi:hypothetical protein